MAVELAERAVNAVIALLQAQLPTEIGAVNTARGDDISLAVPPDENYHSWPKTGIAGGDCHVSVFEQEFGFTSRYSDPASQRAIFSCPITIRVTWFNRENDTKSDMVTKGRRYSAAVFNVFAKNSDIDSTDDAVKIGGVERVVPEWETVDEDASGRVKAQVALTVTVDCEEVQG